MAQLELLKEIVFDVHDKALEAFDYRGSLTGPQILLPVESINVMAAGPISFARGDVLNVLIPKLGELPRLNRYWQVTTTGVKTQGGIELRISIASEFDMMKLGVRKIGESFLSIAERRWL